MRGRATGRERHDGRCRGLPQISQNDHHRRRSARSRLGRCTMLCSPRATSLPVFAKIDRRQFRPGLAYSALRALGIGAGAVAAGFFVAFLVNGPPRRPLAPRTAVPEVAAAARPSDDTTVAAAPAVEAAAPVSTPPPAVEAREAAAPEEPARPETARLRRGARTAASAAGRRFRSRPARWQRRADDRQCGPAVPARPRPRRQRRGRLRPAGSATRGTRFRSAAATTATAARLRHGDRSPTAPAAQRLPRLLRQHRPPVPPLMTGGHQSESPFRHSPSPYAPEAS